MADLKVDRAAVGEATAALRGAALRLAAAAVDRVLGVGAAAVDGGALAQVARREAVTWRHGTAALAAELAALALDVAVAVEELVRVDGGLAVRRDASRHPGP